MSNTTSPPVSNRLMSLDALRGFDMFWIIGADSLVYALSRMSQNPVTKFLAYQLDHAEWEGFRFYDLIFPLFVFMVGASIVFSLTKIINESGRAGAMSRVLRRGILLFAIGIFYSGGFTNPWPDMRLMGVLNRIALAYTAAGLLFCWFKPRTLVAICAGILIGYWAMMNFIPIRDIQLEKTNLAILSEQAGDAKSSKLFRESGNAASINPSAIKDSPAWAAAETMYAATTNRVTGKFDPGLNVANHFDFEHLPARKYDLFFDPEGILSTIPAVATCLLGMFAGMFLWREASPLSKVISVTGCVITIIVTLRAGYFVSRAAFQFSGFQFLTIQLFALTIVGFGVMTAWCIRHKSGEVRKTGMLFAAGLACVALGWFWDSQLHFPVIKKIWTSSYVLVAGGYSAMLLGAFYLVVDVWKYQKWCQPFVWMGMNAITIYLVKNFLGGSFSKLSARFVGGDIKTFLDDHVTKGFGDLMISVGGLLIAFWFVRFLHQKKLFLRV